MATLNQIGEEIAYKLGDQFNTTLRNSIKEDVIDLRAKFIRDDADRNAVSNVHFSQALTLQFEVVNILDEFNANFDCLNSICPDVQYQDKYKVLKSKKPVPIPIRFKNSGRNPFMYVGRVDGSKAFVYTTLEQFPYIRTLKYSLKTIFYIIYNQHLYIINNLGECDINQTLNLCNVLVKGIFENPRDFYNACENGDKFIDDMEFPIGRDMLVQLKDKIYSSYMQKPKDGEQVNIDSDDNK